MIFGLDEPLRRVRVGVEVESSRDVLLCGDQAMPSGIAFRYHELSRIMSRISRGVKGNNVLGDWVSYEGGERHRWWDPMSSCIGIYVRLIWEINELDRAWKWGEGRDSDVIDGPESSNLN